MSPAEGYLLVFGIALCASSSLIAKMAKSDAARKHRPHQCEEEEEGRERADEGYGAKYYAIGCKGPITGAI